MQNSYEEEDRKIAELQGDEGKPAVEESNDYIIEVRLEVEGKGHRAEIQYMDGQPTNVTFGYALEGTPAGLVRVVQQLMHAGSGPSFKAIGQAQLQGAGVAPGYPLNIPRVAGPSALY